MAWLIGILAAALIGIVSLQFRGRRITSLGSPKRSSSGSGRERSVDQELDFVLGRDTVVCGHCAVSLSKKTSTSD